MVLGDQGRADATRWCCIISTCRPAATFPIRRSIRNSSTSSRFLDEMTRARRCIRAPRCAPYPGRRPQRRAARARRLDRTSSCSTWCRTPRSNARSSLAVAAHRRLDRCRTPCACRFRRKIYTWWSYRAADWVAVQPWPPARPHLGVASAGRSRQGFQHHPRRARLGTPVGSCAGNGGAGALNQGLVL